MRYLPMLALLSALIIGCEQAETDPNSSTFSESTADSTVPARLDIPLVDRDSTRYYTYRISYPGLIRTDSLIRATTRDFADEHKQKFLQLFEGGDPPQTASYPWELRLEFTVQDSSSSFVSVLGSGYVFSGGAHGNNFFRTINVDRRTGKLLQLSDLLADSTALVPIRNYVKDKLTEKLVKKSQQQDNPQASGTSEEQIRQWVREGTKPHLDNYQYFWLSEPANGHTTGLTFLFPPYQVAPYAEGNQQVFVPASVFAGTLSPVYREWFGISY